MKSTLLAAGIVAAALSAGVTTARAADLDYGRVPDRYSGAYEDPRYRDLYGPDQRYSEQQRYYPAPVPPATVYRDDYRPYPPRYSQADPYARNGCIHKDEARQRLMDEGWRDFHDLELRNGYARIKARRGNGDLYDLKVDRCTGEVVNAQVLSRGGYGPYADNGPRYVPSPRPYY